MNLSRSTSCASSSSSSVSAVAPTTFDVGSALRNVCCARPSRTMFPPSKRHSFASRPASLSLSRNRRRLTNACGLNVGAAFTSFPPPAHAFACMSSRTPSCALTSFFPPCRAISTVNVSPRRRIALANTARAISNWYNLSSGIPAIQTPFLNPHAHRHTGGSRYPGVPGGAPPPPTPPRRTHLANPFALSLSKGPPLTPQTAAPPARRPPPPTFSSFLPPFSSFLPPFSSFLPPFSSYRRKPVSRGAGWGAPTANPTPSHAPRESVRPEPVEGPPTHATNRSTTRTTTSPTNLLVIPAPSRHSCGGRNPEGRGCAGIPLPTASALRESVRPEPVEGPPLTPQTATPPAPRRCPPSRHKPQHHPHHHCPHHRVIPAPLLVIPAPLLVIPAKAGIQRGARWGAPATNPTPSHVPRESVRPEPVEGPPAHATNRSTTRTTTSPTNLLVIPAPLLVIPAPLLVIPAPLLVIPAPLSSFLPPLVIPAKAGIQRGGATWGFPSPPQAHLANPFALSLSKGPPPPPATLASPPTPTVVPAKAGTQRRAARGNPLPLITQGHPQTQPRASEQKGQCPPAPASKRGIAPPHATNRSTTCTTTAPTTRKIRLFTRSLTSFRPSSSPRTRSRICTSKAESGTSSASGPKRGGDHPRRVDLTLSKPRRHRPSARSSALLPFRCATELPQSHRRADAVDHPRQALRQVLLRLRLQPVAQRHHPHQHAHALPQ